MEQVSITIESIIDGLAVTSFGLTPKKARLNALCLFCKDKVMPKINSLDDLHNWEEYLLCPECVNGKEV